jgi:hypothetical protein
VRGLALLALAACGPRAAPPGLVPSDLPLDGVAYLNAWLLGRTSANQALGTFVPEDAKAVDGSSGQRTSCSSWFEVVDADVPSRPPKLLGGTPDAAKSAGIPEGGEATVWPDFAPTGRQVAAIKDPHGLAACCQGDPAACTGRYIGEVLVGTGKLYRVDRSAGAPQWYPAAKVGGPYAVRLSGNPYVGEECGAWREGVPRAAHGTFVLGVSTATRSEENARADALRQARQAALAWLKANNLGDSHLNDLSEERWCVESFPGETGEMEHLAHLLAYQPEKK